MIDNGVQQGKMNYVLKYHVQIHEGDKYWYGPFSGFFLAVILVTK